MATVSFKLSSKYQLSISVLRETRGSTYVWQLHLPHAQYLVHFSNVKHSFISYILGTGIDIEPIKFLTISPCLGNQYLANIWNLYKLVTTGYNISEGSFYRYVILKMSLREKRISEKLL